MIRIWLKMEATEGIVELREHLCKERVFQSLPVMVRKWGIGVKYCHSSGRWYVDYDERISPSPNILPCLIEKATLQDTIWRGLRIDGVYRHEGAELVATTQGCVVEDRGTSFYKESQSIKVSAPSAEALMAIYTLFRQGGNFMPDEPWEDDFVEPKLILLVGS